MVEVLFLCSANKDRSLTAEHHFSHTYPHHIFDSAWLNAKEVSKAWRIMCKERMLEQADLIYVMTDNHKNIIKNNLQETQQWKLRESVKEKLSVLSIKDDYPYGSKELITILEEKLSHVLSQEDL